MVKEIYKKILTFGVVMAFIGLALIPTINAVDINVDKVKTLAPEKSKSDISNTDCDLLIITADKFANLLQPLKNHKEKYGVKTEIVTLSYVYDEILNGYDAPEKIKLFIKQAEEETGIKYVLLIGNFRKMPVRYVFNDEPSPSFNEPCFISELYYADIYDDNGDFSSWDTNNNGIYGEWTGEEAPDKDIDLYPDVFVGRLACKNTKEVRQTVKKIITYETSTYGKEWFNRIVAIAGDTYPDGHYPFPTPEYEGEENAKTVISYMPGFENTTLFTSDGTFSGPKDIIREINKGSGFLFFDGHGNPMAWTTHKPNSTEWVQGLKLSTMTFLINRNKLPVCVVGGCHNSQFDVTPLNLLKNFWESFSYGTYATECWSWKLTRKMSGGSIATIGNSGLGMTKEDKESQEGASDFLDSQFFYEYGINGTDILGETWGNAITNYLDEFPIDWNTPAGWDFAIDAKTVQQWVLLGDPSLKIGGYPPQ